MNKRPPNLPLGAVLVALACAALPGAGDCQVFGTHLVRTSSDHPEIQNPGGYGAFAQIPISSWMDLRLAYDRISKTSEGPGEVCNHYAPNFGCRTQPTRTSTTLGNLGIGLIPSVQLGEAVRLGVGVGFGMTQISASSIAVESGRRANFETPKTAQLGAFGLVSAAVSPSPRVPLTLVGTAAIRRIDFKGCVSYEEVYAPFCGSTSMGELGLGLAVHF